MKYKIEFKGEFMKEKNKGAIALLDTSIILHNIRLGKNEAKFGAGLIDSLRALKLAIGVDYIYCIGDSGHSSYRKKLLENYKGDRAVANKKLDDKASARLSEMRQFNKNLSNSNIAVLCLPISATHSSSFK